MGIDGEPDRVKGAVHAGKAAPNGRDLGEGGLSSTSIRLLPRMFLRPRSSWQTRPSANMQGIFGIGNPGKAGTNVGSGNGQQGSTNTTSFQSGSTPTPKSGSASSGKA